MNLSISFVEVDSFASLFGEINKSIYNVAIIEKCEDSMRTGLLGEVVRVKSPHTEILVIDSTLKACSENLSTLQLKEHLSFLLEHSKNSGEVYYETQRGHF